MSVENHLALGHLRFVGECRVLVDDLQLLDESIDEPLEPLVVAPARLSPEALHRIRAAPHAVAEELDGTRSPHERRETLVEADLALHEEVIVGQLVKYGFDQIDFIEPEQG